MASEQTSPSGETSDSRFFFVKPSAPGGRIDAYPGSRVLSRTSWEWLLERYLRRRILLDSLSAEFQSRYVAERRGVFRLDGLASQGTLGGREPSVPDGLQALLPGTSGRTSGSARGPDYSRVGVSYRFSGLACSVMDMALDGQSLAEWAVPGPPGGCVRPSFAEAESSSSASGYAYEEEDVSSGGTEGSWTETGSLTVGELDPSVLPFFLMLSDFRTDDPLAEKSVPVWDADRGEFAAVANLRVHPAPFASTADTDASTGEFRSVTVAGSRRNVLVFRGVLSAATRAAAFPCNAYLKDPESRSRSLSLPQPGFYVSSAWESGVFYGSIPRDPDQDGAYAEATLDDTGVRKGFPAAERGGEGLVDPGDGVSAGDGYAVGRNVVYRYLPSPDWSGRPTWWAANGFPHLDPEPVEPAVRRQLEAFSVQQPSAPPCVRSGLGIPAADWRETGREAAVRLSVRRQASVLSPVVPSCCPAEISRHLDALETTVVEVEKLFAFVSVRQTGTASSSTKYRSSGPDGKSSSKARREVRLARTVSGRYCGSFEGLLTGIVAPLEIPSARLTASGSDSETETDAAGDVRAGTAVWSCRFAMETDFTARRLAPLRASSPLASGLVDTVETESEAEGSGTGTDRTRDKTSSGTRSDDPPGEEDLLLGPELLKWVKAASLYALVDATAAGRGWTRSADKTGSSATVYSDYTMTEGGPVAQTAETTGQTVRATRASGRETRRRRFGVVHVGDLSLSDGTLGEFDVVDFVRSAVPAPGTGRKPPPGVLSDAFAPDYGRSPWRDSKSSDETTASEGDGTSTTSLHSASTSTDTPPDLVESVLFGTARLFLVVQWDFDTDRPPEVSAGGRGLAWRYMAAEERVRRARLAVEDADAEASGYSLEAAGVLSSLDSLEALMSATGPELDAMVSAAEDEVEESQSELEAAQEALEAAQEALARGEGASGESLSAAVRAASAVLEDAQGRLDSAESALGEMQQAATASEADARGEISRVRQSAESFRGELSGWTGAGAAGAAVAAAQNALLSASGEDSMAAAEGLAAAAEQAAAALGQPLGGFRSSAESLRSGLQDARAAVWAYVGRG